VYVGVWVDVGMRVGVEVHVIVLVGSVNCVRVGKAVAIVGLLVDSALAQPGSRNSTKKIKMYVL
jgi:hypothetical protein